VKRATVYFDEDLYTALKLKAVETSQSVSELVNVAIKEALFEDLEDLNSFDERKEEPPIRFEDFVKELKVNGKI
jgi:hypothetical protein